MKYTDDNSLPPLSAGEFATARANVRTYTALILRKGPRYEPPGNARSDAVSQIIYAHGMRNARLRLADILPVVCPVDDGSDVAGFGVLDADLDEAHLIMSGDPAVKENILTYELHACWSFPIATLDSRTGIPPTLSDW